MSTVIAFTPTRSRASRRPADVVPIGAARGARAVRVSSTPRTARPVRDRELAAADVVWPEVVPAPIRLTRRGRLVAGGAAAVLLIIALAAGVLLISHQAFAGEVAQPISVSYRVVLPGETLWSIAGEVAPSADRRDTMDRIVEFNALGSVGVQAGQRIAIPSDLTHP